MLGSAAQHTTRIARLELAAHAKTPPFCCPRAFPHRTPLHQRLEALLVHAYVWPRCDAPSVDVPAAAWSRSRPPGAEGAGSGPQKLQECPKRAPNQTLCSCHQLTGAGPAATCKPLCQPSSPSLLPSSWHPRSSEPWSSSSHEGHRRTGTPAGAAGWRVGPPPCADPGSLPPP